MTWDYAEANIFGKAAGDYELCCQSLCEVLERLTVGNPCHVEQMAAIAVSKKGEGWVFSTDPPYYDNLCRTPICQTIYVLAPSLVEPGLSTTSRNSLNSKTEELVADQFRHGGKDNARSFFEEGIRGVFEKLREASNPHYPTTIYYAFKQAEDGEDIR